MLVSHFKNLSGLRSSGLSNNDYNFHNSYTIYLTTFSIHTLQPTLQPSSFALPLDSTISAPFSAWTSTESLTAFDFYFNWYFNHFDHFPFNVHCSSFQCLYSNWHLTIKFFCSSNSYNFHCCYTSTAFSADTKVSFLIHVVFWFTHSKGYFTASTNASHSSVYHLYFVSHFDSFQCLNFIWIFKFCTTSAIYPQIDTFTLHSVLTLKQLLSALLF